TQVFPQRRLYCQFWEKSRYGWHVRGEGDIHLILALDVINALIPVKNGADGHKHIGEFGCCGSPHASLTSAHHEGESRFIGERQFELLGFLDERQRDIPLWRIGQAEG